MVSGTLYTYPRSHGAYKVLIAAAYSGVSVEICPNFVFGKTNEDKEFLQKFPLGKVPAFEDSNGNCLSETNAIARYVSNDTLLGGPNAINQALVQQYIEFADNEILPSACTWTFPTLGFKQYNKQDTEKAIFQIKKCLAYLNDVLLSKTYLVGERITLADISLTVDLLTLYVQVLEPSFRAPYGNVNRWFLTCINQPNFKKIIGEGKLCESMATFDNKRYQELHPKDQKKAPAKETKPKKEEKSKKEEKLEEPTSLEDEYDTPAPTKKVDYFADVPESKFVFDDWKKMYSNNKSEVYLPWFYEHFDKNAASIWHCDYMYNDENKVKFVTSNLVSGWMQRLDGPLRKSAFGLVMTTYNEEKAYFAIHGVWLFRGQNIAFNLNPDWGMDSEYYKFKKLDIEVAEDKQLFEKYFHDVENNLYADFHCYK